MVLIDATTLLLFLSPLAEPPRDPVTILPIEHAQLRVEHLVKSLASKRTRILVPAPALSEVLVRANRRPAICAKDRTQFGVPDRSVRHQGRNRGGHDD